MKAYTVYLKETGEKVAEGTAFECMKMMGVSSINSFHSLVSNCKSGKNNKYTVEDKELNLTKAGGN